MKRLKIFGKRSSFLNLIVIVLFSIFLVVNIDYYSVPNPDVFQYIDDSRVYGSFRLPDNIHQPPANPVLIAVISRFITFLPNFEIKSAHLINILSSIIGLWYVVSVVKRFSISASMAVLIYLITNALFVFQSLDITSEVLFFASQTASIYYYVTNRKKAAYVIAGLSFLIRFEALLLLVVFSFYDVFYESKKHTDWKSFLMGYAPVAAWIFIISSKNSSGTLVGNTYVQEVLGSMHRIPQFSMLTNAPELMFHDIYRFNIPTSFLGLAIIAAMLLVIRKYSVQWRVLSVYAVLYLFMHIFFPFAPDRYLIPVLWILIASLLLAGKVALMHVYKNSYLVGRAAYGIFAIGFLTVVLSNSVWAIKAYRFPYSENGSYDRFKRHEDRLAASWLNVNILHPTDVISYDPGIMNYFVTNKHVNVLFIDPEVYQQCDTVSCIIEEIDGNNEVLYIQKSYMFKESDGSFPSYSIYNGAMLSRFPQGQDQKRFKLVESLENVGQWVRIYKDTP